MDIMADKARRDAEEMMGIKRAKKATTVKQHSEVEKGGFGRDDESHAVQQLTQGGN